MMRTDVFSCSLMRRQYSAEENTLAKANILKVCAFVTQTKQVLAKCYIPF